MSHSSVEAGTLHHTVLPCIILITHPKIYYMHACKYTIYTAMLLILLIVIILLIEKTKAQDNNAVMTNKVVS